MMGSRGGGSIRGFGRFGVSLILSLIDSFNRANGSLGSSSDGKSVWSVNRGNFSIDSNKAYSTDTGNSLATVPMDSSTIVSADINIEADKGGVGLAFWVTDANSWWSIYPGYESTTTTSTNTSCSGNVYICFDIQSTPADACNRACSDISVMAFCEENNQYAGSQMVYNSCSYPGRINVANFCLGATGFSGNYLVCTGGCCYAGKSTTSTTSTTTVESSINIRNQNGVQHKNAYSTSASISPTNSIAISTVGDTITYSAYSAADKGGSVRTASTYTPSSPTKGKRVGVFKTASQSFQGSYVDNISVTVI